MLGVSFPPEGYLIGAGTQVNPSRLAHIGFQRGIILSTGVLMVPSEAFSLNWGSCGAQRGIILIGVLVVPSEAGI